MAVALVALVVAASGGAYAAVKGSGPTITVCVHHQGGGLYRAHKCARHDRRLSWNVTGPAGARGPRGVRGAPGPFAATLPSGKTLTGDYFTSSETGSTFDDTQSFAFPLASEPSVHFVGISAADPPQCAGTVANPQAAPGNLCVYAALGGISASAVEIINPETDLTPDASTRGFRVSMNGSGSFSTGSWAVTAP